MYRLVLLLLAFSTLSLRGQVMSPADTKALLARIQQQRGPAPTFEAEFQETRKVHLLDEPILTTGKIWFQAPNHFRLERRGNAPSITISDGQQFWIYYPRFNSAERYSLARRSPLESALTAILAGLSLQNLEASYQVSASQNGDKYQLELAPKGPSLRRVFQHLTITLDSKLQPVHTDLLQPNGDSIVTEYRNPTQPKIPPAIFQFTPPAGTEVSTPLGR